MVSNTAYERMLIYKMQRSTKNNVSDKQKQIDFAIKTLNGFKSHSHKDLMKEYNLIRKGDING